MWPQRGGERGVEGRRRILVRVRVRVRVRARVKVRVRVRVRIRIRVRVGVGVGVRRHRLCSLPNLNLRRCVTELKVNNVGKVDNPKVDKIVPD